MRIKKLRVVEFDEWNTHYALVVKNAVADWLEDFNSGDSGFDDYWTSDRDQNYDINISINTPKTEDWKRLMTFTITAYPLYRNSEGELSVKSWGTSISLGLIIIKTNESKNTSK